MRGETGAIVSVRRGSEPALKELPKRPKPELKPPAGAARARPKVHVFVR